MKQQTISSISKTYGLSTRTLRYYEQIGLIKSEKAENYAYRVYGEDTVHTLEQIIILRRLRIPLKQIAFILQSRNTGEIIDAFCKSLAEVDDEITALCTIREILSGFITRLNTAVAESGTEIKLDITSDTALLEAVDALSGNKQNGQKNSQQLKSASEKLGRLTDKDVRIIYLPPMTLREVYVGENEQVPSGFIKSSGLKDVYPSARVFAQPGTDDLLRYVSVPGNTEPQTETLCLKGGIYAAYMVQAGESDEWHRLREWVNGSKNFDICPDCCCLEEYLNHWEWEQSGKSTGNQLDLLLPVKPRFAAGTGHPQERIKDTFSYNGVPVEIVRWDGNIWCGKVGYAADNVSEPDVDGIMNAFHSLDLSKAEKRKERDWDVCISLNYLSDSRPNGLFVGFLTGTENQPEGFDTLKFPPSLYLRISLNDESALAVGDIPWKSGIPPYKWVGEQLAPAFGYKYADDTLPIVEYYGFFNLQTYTHEFRYLYVPVIKLS